MYKKERMIKIDFIQMQLENIFKETYYRNEVLKYLYDFNNLCSKESLCAYIKINKDDLYSLLEELESEGLITDLQNGWLLLTEKGRTTVITIYPDIAPTL